MTMLNIYCLFRFNIYARFGLYRNNTVVIQQAYKFYFKAIFSIFGLSKTVLSVMGNKTIKILKTLQILYFLTKHF